MNIRILLPLLCAGVLVSQAKKHYWHDTGKRDKSCQTSYILSFDQATEDQLQLYAQNGESWNVETILITFEQESQRCDAEHKPDLQIPTDFVKKFLNGITLHKEPSNRKRWSVFGICTALGAIVGAYVDIKAHLPWWRTTDMGPALDGSLIGSFIGSMGIGVPIIMFLERNNDLYYQRALIINRLTQSPLYPSSIELTQEQKAKINLAHEICP